MGDEIELPPTRAEHIRAGEKLADELGFVGEFADEVARAYADARASERHVARVRYVRACLREHVTVPVREGRPEVVEKLLPVLAHFVLFGQGGPRDAGGPMAASQLPILPTDRQFRWRCRSGAAWIAAIREIAAGTKIEVVVMAPHNDIYVMYDEHWLLTVRADGGRVVWGLAEPKWGACIVRALVGRQWVDGTRHDVVVRRVVSDDAKFELEEDIAEAIRRAVARRIASVS